MVYVTAKDVAAGCKACKNGNDLKAYASRKHAYIILTPLKPHFYTEKLGFTEYALFFLFLLKNIDCGYSLEPPRRGGSNKYPQSMFWTEM